jgi:hypothetical protein
MPISIAEHPHSDQVMVIVSGEMSMQEMVDFIASNRNGPRRSFAFLFDISAATVSLSGEEIRQLATYGAAEARKSPMGPVAFISTDPSTFGMSRMYQSYSAAEGRKNVGVFHTVSDAQAWLAALNPTQGFP